MYFKTSGKDIEWDLQRNDWHVPSKKHQDDHDKKHKIIENYDSASTTSYVWTGVGIAFVVGIVGAYIYYKRSQSTPSVSA